MPAIAALSGHAAGPRHSGWSNVTDTSISKCLYCTPKLLRVAVSKVERLVNLVIALLSTAAISPQRNPVQRRGLSCSASDEASRDVERDKNELRDLGSRWKPAGCPLSTGRGYRINREAYAFPPSS